MYADSSLTIKTIHIRIFENFWLRKLGKQDSSAFFGTWKTAYLQPVNDNIAKAYDLWSLITPVILRTKVLLEEPQKRWRNWNETLGQANIKQVKTIL